MVEARNISYSAGSKQLLKHISLQFHPGKLNLIIGPNGAGKSTLIKVLSGQTAEYKGQVLYDGNDISTISIRELAKVRAVLSQSLELTFPMKVWEVVMMGRYPHFTGKQERKDVEAAEAAMAFFAVTDLAQRDYQTLSGGEKQRVHFARVIAQIWYPHDAGRYLFLDEPLTFLDIFYQFDFMQRLQELLRTQDITIIGVVHDLNLAARFAHHIVLLNASEVLSSGSPEEVLTADLIFKAYGLRPSITMIEGRQYLAF